ncbi:hypothetical protein LAG90_01950 [Marinilongibacter aquaticus]|uniref:hypothetical protein n=1 Tax=Marinilongibacter aquaticus TaxID=2975157 RepID=UPI0021BD77E9|nr:hypothetical protein [Marinilongibacter aquaticus]UBM59420.1 hypothetical protein LAG90_01950 [Marinilongibacter aquaticus]
MKKITLLLVLLVTCIGVSGFGVPENNVYVHREQNVQSTPVKLDQMAVSSCTAEDSFSAKEVETVSENIFSKSLAEKVGEFLVNCLHVCVKAILSIFR